MENAETMTKLCDMEGQFNKNLGGGCKNERVGRDKNWLVMTALLRGWGIKL
jgi:hypothetical protein